MWNYQQNPTLSSFSQF